MKLDAWIKKACALKKHHPWPKAWALKAQKPKYSLPRLFAGLRRQQGPLVSLASEYSNSDFDPALPDAALSVNIRDGNAAVLSDLKGTGSDGGVWRLSSSICFAPWMSECQNVSREGHLLQQTNKQTHTYVSLECQNVSRSKYGWDELFKHLKCFVDFQMYSIYMCVGACVKTQQLFPSPEHQM